MLTFLALFYAFRYDGEMAQSDTTTQRFWNKVSKAGPDECWPWTAARLPRGYGVFSWNGRQGLAHRFSCELALNRSLAPTEYVLHACDRPECVNPSHLRIGTQGDNIKDCWDKKRRVMRDISGSNSPWRTHPHRMPTGEKVNTAVLTEAQVRTIWRMTLAGLSGKEVSEHVGAPLAAVRAIAQGRSWRHLPDAPSVEALKAGGKRQAPKLSPDDIETVKRMLAAGETVAAVARMFGVSTAPISNIKNHGKTWVPKP